MFDIYVLLQNQIADIYNNLTAKITKDNTQADYTPKWKVSTIVLAGKEEMIVEELQSLLGLKETLRKLADHHDHSSTTQIMPQIPDFNESPQ